MTNKCLHEMDDLRDMGRFPLVIYAGATTNVLMSIAATWAVLNWRNETWILWIWAVGLIGLNLSPVVVLRRLDRELLNTPPIERMSFFRDQHRFATWVYAVASGNLFFWIMSAAAVHSYSTERTALIFLLFSAFVLTTFPAWWRWLQRG